MPETKLKDVPFFSHLSKKELSTVSQHVDQIDVQPGKELVREGELGHEFFVIEEGTAEVLRAGARIAELGPGDFFGEMALLDADRRTATVRASSPMQVLVMTRQSFRAIHRSMPEVHDAVSAAITQRKAPAQGATAG